MFFPGRRDLFWSVQARPEEGCGRRACCGDLPSRKENEDSLGESLNSLLSSSCEAYHRPAGSQAEKCPEVISIGWPHAYARLGIRRTRRRESTGAPPNVGCSCPGAWVRRGCTFGPDLPADCCTPHEQHLLLRGSTAERSLCRSSPSLSIRRVHLARLFSADEADTEREGSALATGKGAEIGGVEIVDYRVGILAV
jgi:hypothetical protein